MKKALNSDNYSARPVVFDYRSAHEFFQDIMLHYKATSNFSVRQRVQNISGCSSALVSQVLAGNRRLTRDQLPSFAKLFKLSNFEFDYIDKNLSSSNLNSCAIEKFKEDIPKKRETKNHILSSWLNLYVKDLVSLKGFSLKPQVLHKMLLGLASPEKIEKSVAFLLREGFWRRTASDQVVAEEDVLVSTNEIPNEKIKEFHKQALKIALRGLDVFPSDRRKASTVLVSLNKDKLPELRSMIDSFQNQLLKFVEDNPDGRDDLIQVAIHLTPVGVKNE